MKRQQIKNPQPWHLAWWATKLASNLEENPTHISDGYNLGWYLMKVGGKSYAAKVAPPDKDGAYNFSFSFAKEKYGFCGGADSAKEALKNLLCIFNRFTNNNDNDSGLDVVLVLVLADADQYLLLGKAETDKLKINISLNPNGTTTSKLICRPIDQSGGHGWRVSVSPYAIGGPIELSGCCLKMKEIEEHQHGNTWGEKARIHSLCTNERIEGFGSREKFVEWYTKQERVCAYCKTSEKVLKELFCNQFEPKKLAWKHGNLQIERKDPSKGYNAENCVLACVHCNNAKSDIISHEDWCRFFAKRMGMYLRKKSDSLKKQKTQHPTSPKQPSPKE